MAVYSWSIDLVWALLGGAVSEALGKLFTDRMSIIAGVAAGVSSLLLVVMAPPGLEEYAGMLSGYFAGTLTALLLKQIRASVRIQGALFLSLFGLSLVIVAVYWVMAVVKVFRYHYGLGPEYPVTEPLVVFGIIALVQLALLRLLFARPLGPRSFLFVLWATVIAIGEQIPACVVLFQIIGWLFVEGFEVSWLVTFGAIAGFVIVALVKILTQLAAIGALTGGQETDAP